LNDNGLKPSQAGFSANTTTVTYLKVEGREIREESETGIGRIAGTKKMKMGNGEPGSDP
jgi:hypothetical protein